MFPAEVLVMIPIKNLTYITLAIEDTHEDEVDEEEEDDKLTKVKSVKKVNKVKKLSSDESYQVMEVI